MPITLISQACSYELGPKTPFWVEFNSRVTLPIVQQIRIAEVHQSLNIKDVGTGVKLHAPRGQSPKSCR